MAPRWILPAMMCLAAAMPAGARAATAQDPSSSPEIVRLADEASNCMTESYLALRKHGHVKDGRIRVRTTLKATLKEAAQICGSRLRALHDRYDAIFGPGMGDAFFKQSYLPDLNRAIMERAEDTPEQRRKVAALQKNGQYISGGDTAKCPYKTFLDKKVQEKIDRAVADIRLRDDLVGKRFMTTQVDLMIQVDDPDFLLATFSNTRQAEACFPFFKKRMKALREEYDAKLKAKVAAAQAAGE